jgi:hypothetical protein
MAQKFLFGLALFFVSWPVLAQDTAFLHQLKVLPGVVSVEEIAVDKSFEKQFDIYFQQLIDHSDSSAGYFNQRVVLSHQGFDKPMVVELEGYHLWSTQRGELAELMHCNQLNIEHRFFKDSKPDSIPWDKLTIWQAASDQHQIIQVLKPLYQQNWISTGISKGGQTTMYHRLFYPNDVKASVPYVAPLNFAREDVRIYQFLKSVGTEQDRERIYNFQCACFESMDSMLVLFKQKTKAKDWHFALGLKKAMQYSILEYSFAFWQWGGYQTIDIPKKNASAKALFQHLYQVSGFTFFEDADLESNRPFFYAALTEMGIYGYETKPFEKYLGDTTIYTFDFSAPKGTKPVFNPESMQQVKTFLDSAANNMLFIVGGLDTWGATAYVPSGKNNLVRMTLANGHHGTRIRHFEKKDRMYIYSLLNEWFGTQINDPANKD